MLKGLYNIERRHLGCTSTYEFGLSLFAVLAPAYLTFPSDWYLLITGLLISIRCLLKHVNYYICIDNCLSQIIATDLQVKSTLQALTMTVNFFFKMLLILLFFSPTILWQISNGNFSPVTLSQLWISPRKKKREILT